MVKRKLLGTGLLGVLLAGALAIASETHGTPVSNDEAQSIRGGCVGFYITNCSGWKCGTGSLVVSGGGSGDEAPSGQVLRCGGGYFGTCSACMSGAASCNS